MRIASIKYGIVLSNNFYIVKQAYTLLKEKKIIFWDFDGVIKDSVAAKTMGYEKLFLPFGEEVLKRVKRHHVANGGVSRYKKIPLYLNWAGEPTTSLKVQEFCNQFSSLVQQAVIDSPWVPGVHEYLKLNYTRQIFIIITGTPQEEITRILFTLDITRYFKEVYGAPKTKATVVNDVLQRLNFLPDQALVVGDSKTDFEAAEKNNVAFLLRRTPFNQELQKHFQGPSFEYLKS